MADNSTLPATADIIRDIQKGGAVGPKTQVMVIDRGGAGAEDLSPLDGTDITTPTAMPAGGVGMRGWLSAIWTKLNGTLAVTGTFFQATQPVSGPLTDTQLRATAVPVSVSSQPLPTGASTEATQALVNGKLPAFTTLWVSATAASGVAATASLPAVAGQFHYITAIDIQLYATAARTGAATPVTVTTTNLPGSPAWPFPTAQAIGAIDRYDVPLLTALKSSVVNTATTIAAPIATAGIWRINVGYYTAP